MSPVDGEGQGDLAGQVVAGPGRLVGVDGWRWPAANTSLVGQTRRCRRPVRRRRPWPGPTRRPGCEPSRARVSVSQRANASPVVSARSLVGRVCKVAHWLIWAIVHRSAAPRDAGVSGHHLGQAARHLGTAGREQPADLVVDPDDLPRPARFAVLVGHPQVAFQRRFSDPVIDRAGRRRHQMQRPAVQAPPHPIAAADPVQYRVMGVDLHVTGPAHPMIERRDHQPGGVDLADPVVPGPRPSRLPLQIPQRRGHPFPMSPPDGLPTVGVGRRPQHAHRLRGRKRQIEPGHRPTLIAPPDPGLHLRPHFPGPWRVPVELAADPLGAGTRADHLHLPAGPPLPPLRLMGLPSCFQPVGHPAVPARTATQHLIRTRMHQQPEHPLHLLLGHHPPQPQLGARRRAAPPARRLPPCHIRRVIVLHPHRHLLPQIPPTTPHPTTSRPTGTVSGPVADVVHPRVDPPDAQHQQVTGEAEGRI